jgi:hypothetical protein
MPSEGALFAVRSRSAGTRENYTSNGDISPNVKRKVATRSCGAYIAVCACCSSRNDPDLGELLAEVLRAHGHTILVAADGREALEVLRVASETEAERRADL